MTSEWIDFFEDLFRRSESTKEAQKEIWEHAASIDKIADARIALMRATYPKGQRP